MTTSYYASYYKRNREKVLEHQRAYYELNREKCLERQREWRERLKRGEIKLPEVDWAICARGGSEAQARAHRRRGEKPCHTCLRAETAATLRRRAAKRSEGDND